MRKAKFRVGQVVAIEQMSGSGGCMGYRYLPILTITPRSGYYDLGTAFPRWYEERDLRALTAREWGPRRSRKGGKK